MAEQEILNFHQALHFAIGSILFCFVFLSRDVRQGRQWVFLLQLTKNWNEIQQWNIKFPGALDKRTKCLHFLQTRNNTIETPHFAVDGSTAQKFNNKSSGKLKKSTSTPKSLDGVVKTIFFRQTSAYLQIRNFSAASRLLFELQSFLLIPLVSTSKINGDLTC